jgi:AhpD family alkylhydroperoxidase
LDTKIKWLIAVGAAFTANCQPCLKTIAKKAFESGADKKEIAEAIGVAKAVRKNSNLQMDRFAAGLLDMQITENTKGSCGCGGEKE